MEETRNLDAAEALLDVARARLIAYRQYDNLNAASNMRGINHRRCECGICIAVDKWMAEHNAYLARPAAPAAPASLREALEKIANHHISAPPGDGHCGCYFQLKDMARASLAHEQDAAGEGDR